jgi:hypothetical protein
LIEGKNKKENKMAMDKCTKCNVSIQEFITGRKKIGDKLYCKSCYYEDLGDLIESSPIGMVTSRC